MGNGWGPRKKKKNDLDNLHLAPDFLVTKEKMRNFAELMFDQWFCKKLNKSRSEEFDYTLEN